MKHGMVFCLGRICIYPETRETGMDSVGESGSGVCWKEIGREHVHRREGKRTGCSFVL